MNRKWILTGTLLAALMGAAAIAQAEETAPAGRPGGFGRWAQGVQGQKVSPNWAPGSQAGGPGFMAGGRGMGRNQAAMGGRGMMGGGAMMGGRGMMGGGPGAETCNGANYDPAANAARLEQNIAQHEAYIETLKAQLNGANETTAAFINQRIVFQQMMLEYQTAKLAVLKDLTLPWPEGAIALARFDRDYFSQVTSDDAWVKSWVERRLAQIQQRLQYLENLGTDKN